MPIAIALVVLTLGSVLFHLLSPWWWTPIASNWGYIDNTITITFWITGFVFSAVILFMAYCVYRFRHRMGAMRCTARKQNSGVVACRGNRGGRRRDAGAGAVCLAPIYHCARQMPRLSKSWASNGSGRFRLPGKDGKLGTSDTRNISPDNPLGLSPNDPKGQDDIVVVSDDLHLAGGQTGKDPAACHRRRARFLRSGIPGQRWT